MLGGCVLLDECSRIHNVPKCMQFDDKTHVSVRVQHLSAAQVLISKSVEWLASAYPHTGSLGQVRCPLLILSPALQSRSFAQLGICWCLATVVGVTSEGRIYCANNIGSANRCRPVTSWLRLQAFHALITNEQLHVYEDVGTKVGLSLRIVSAALCGICRIIRTPALISCASSRRR